jgi:hypothetical protein
MTQHLGTVQGSTNASTKTPETLAGHAVQRFHVRQYDQYEPPVLYRAFSFRKGLYGAYTIKDKP